MDLLQLRYFQAVARHEHVSRAAEELRVAQPALSRAIARLESELGMPLFDRRGRRVALNRFGAAFLSRADNALAELDQGRRELADAAGLARGSVAVAAETLRTLTDLVAGFLAGHQQVSIQLRQSAAPAMSAQLLAGEVDLCLASQPLSAPSSGQVALRSAGPGSAGLGSAALGSAGLGSAALGSAGLGSAVLLREDVLLGVPLGHRLAGRAGVSVTELAGEPFVTTRPGYWQRALAEELFGSSGTRPRIACEGDEPYAIRGLISAGVGVGLLPAQARSVADPPVGWVRLDATGCRRTLRIVWREGAYLSAAARSFRDFAVRHFRDRPATD